MSLENASYSNPDNDLLESARLDSPFSDGIYDFLPSLICIYDVANNKLQYVNRKITDVLGFSHDDLKAWGYDFSKVVFKDDLDVVLKEIEKYNSLKGTDSHDYKCRFNCKEGSWRHFHVSGKVLKRKEDGKAESLLFVAQDVTERIQSTEEARGLKELVNETEELLNFGTWTWSIKSDEVIWSKGMYALLGYDKKNLPVITNNFYLNRVAEEDINDVQAALTKAIDEKQPFEKEYTIITSAGEEKRVYSKGKVILNENGDVIKMLGTTRSVIDHSQLNISLTNYKQMALEKEEFLGHGSWELNYLEKNMYWSDGMYRLFGYDPQKDKNVITIDEQLYKLHMTEGDFNSGMLTREDIMSNNKNSYVWEYQIKTKNGELKKLETFGKIIRDRNGSPIRIIGTTRDITQLRNYERELEKKIVELKRSNKDLEDFAYIASHDIQEPLRKITSFSERLKTKYSQQLDDEAKKYLERIMSATKNARLLIDGLMDFSRLTSEGEIFEKADLNVLLQEVKTELELKIEETETVIKSQELPTLEVVPVQIKQLFINLLLNAIKFKKPDASPHIEIKSSRILKGESNKLHLNPLLTYHKITIEDKGIGFEEEYAEKIFEMFQRLHSKAEYPGAGIGLALCKKITENHGGTIFANSELGKGTMFSVILPEMQY
jgi:PAS domain S-box-containing protein